MCTRLGPADPGKAGLEGGRVILALFWLAPVFLPGLVLLAVWSLWRRPAPRLSVVRAAVITWLLTSVGHAGWSLLNRDAMPMSAAASGAVALSFGMMLPFGAAVVVERVCTARLAGVLPTFVLIVLAGVLVAPAAMIIGLMLGCTLDRYHCL